MTDDGTLPALADVCADRRRWAAGERPPVEDYLRRFPARASNPEAVLDLIYTEVVLREEHGERPTRTRPGFPTWPP